jgi:hypothetical protein
MRSRCAFGCGEIGGLDRRLSVVLRFSRCRRVKGGRTAASAEGVGFVLSLHISPALSMILQRRKRTWRLPKLEVPFAGESHLSVTSSSSLRRRPGCRTHLDWRLEYVSTDGSL